MHASLLLLLLLLFYHAYLQLTNQIAEYQVSKSIRNLPGTLRNLPGNYLYTSEIIRKKG